MSATNGQLTIEPGAELHLAHTAGLHTLQCAGPHATTAKQVGLNQLEQALKEQL